MFSGIGVSKGNTSGKVYVCKDSLCTYEKRIVINVPLEKEYAKQAFISAAEGLNKLYELSKEKVGLTVATIVQGHRLMIEDKGCQEQVLALIEKQCANSEWAIQEVFQQYIQMMKQSEDSYLRARAADFEDMLNRVEQELTTVKGISKTENSLKRSEEKFIALGRQFSVEDILNLYKKGAIGILDLSGDEESHALVVAKSLDLPMIIQLEEGCLSLVGKRCIMDGASGSVKAE